MNIIYKFIFTGLLLTLVAHSASAIGTEPVSEEALTTQSVAQKRYIPFEQVDYLTQQGLILTNNQLSAAEKKFYVKGLRRQKRKLDFDAMPKTDIRVGYGVFSTTGLNLDMHSMHDSQSDDYFSDIDLKDDPKHVYHNRTLRTGSIFVQGTYAVNRYIDLGASFYTSHYYEKYRNQSISYQFYGLTASLRVVYLRRDAVTIYSGLSLGAAAKVTSDDSSTRTYASFCGQFTYFGVSFGRRFFGFAELGVGDFGAIAAGIGYKF